MPKSPQQDSEAPVRVRVSSDGSGLADSAALLSVTVHRAINQVPTATLEFADGDMPAQTFPLSDAMTFKPGAKIELSAGYGDREERIFSGIVVRHGLKISAANDARLVVDCRDEAVKMTVGRKSATYENRSDGDIIASLIGAHGLQAKVSGTGVTHPVLVQHHCTDWDFLLARAEANGCIVVATDGTVVVGAPEVNGTPDLRVAYGESLIDFQADLDARPQFSGVSAQAWAKAQRLKSGPSQLRGRMRFQGSALARVGGLIELQGVGERFSGTVFSTGLTHRIEDGDWITEIEFGAPAEWFTERADIVAPVASGLVLGIEGLHVGVVLAVDGDPEGEQRIQVAAPGAGIDRIWARLLQLYASNGFGTFFVPEVGDEVLLGWFNNDPGLPVVLGSLYSSARRPPYAPAVRNDIKAIVTRSRITLEFDDADKVVTLRTPGNNKVVISDKDPSITLTDQNGNKVVLGHDGITLDSPKDVRISAKGRLAIDAAGALSLSSRADVTIDGLNVSCTAQVGVVAKGAASAELSASGQTTVKGAMVMIN